MTHRRAWLMLTIMFCAPLSGCFGDDGPIEILEEDALIPIWERANHDIWFTNGSNGSVLTPGPYELLVTENEWDSVHQFVEYDLPLSEGGDAPDGKISLAYWRPDVPEGVTVPVIAEFGPYFDETSVSTPSIEVPGTWLGEMIIDQILPHGYAFAQVSVSGTGRSNHCMDLMGNAEQLGIDAAVTWMGSQEWSNGKVAMIGKSYDGSTPWQAATFGNEHLATIVPISGLIGVKELMWKNGSSEARAPFMHNVVYGGYGVDGDEEDPGNACPDYFMGPATGGSAYLFGDEMVGTYWEERYFLDRVLQNYEGSVYLIQGMHDWNVDPHMAIPTINLLQEHDIEAKGFFGQWDHDYPDRPDVMYDRSDPGRGREAFPEMVRMDWMQDLYEWFEYYLQDRGPPPWLGVEIQSNQGDWRLESSYPMTETTELALELGSEDLVHITGGNLILPDASSGPMYETAPLTKPLFFGGLARLHINVQTSSYGGQIYALLEDCDESDSCIHIGHAIMDLRYHEGGTEPVIHNFLFPFNAKMEFFAMDAEVSVGHYLRLTLTSTGEDYLPASTSSIVTVIDSGSTLQLDTFDPATRQYYDVPLCSSQLCIDHLDPE